MRIEQLLNKETDDNKSLTDVTKEYEDSLSNHALYRAAHTNNEEEVRNALGKGADPFVLFGGFDAFYWAVKYGNIKTFNLLRYAHSTKILANLARIYFEERNGTLVKISLLQLAIENKENHIAAVIAGTLVKECPHIMLTTYTGENPPCSIATLLRCDQLVFDAIINKNFSAVFPANKPTLNRLIFELVSHVNQNNVAEDIFERVAMLIHKILKGKFKELKKVNGKSNGFLEEKVRNVIVEISHKNQSGYRKIYSVLGVIEQNLINKKLENYCPPQAQNNNNNNQEGNNTNINTTSAPVQLPFPKKPASTSGLNPYRFQVSGQKRSIEQTEQNPEESSTKKTHSDAQTDENIDDSQQETCTSQSRTNS